MAIKTLHITNYYHGTSGGIRTFYHALLAAANVHRREVRLVVPGEHDSVEDIGEFARIYTVAAPQSVFFDSRYRLLFPHLYALPYQSSLKRILVTERPDLVEICDKYTLCYLPSVLRKGWVSDFRPCVLIGLSCERMDDNMSAFVSSKAIARRFSEWYMQKIYGPRFDHHISVSEYAAVELRRALSARTDLPIHVCPMGVDAQLYDPARRRVSKRNSLLALFPKPKNIDKRTQLLLCVCRVSPEKNTGLLPEMMELLGSDSTQDYRLLIAGAGPSAQWLEEISECVAPGCVRLLGHVRDREDLADVYANCDALVHPNPREPLGLAPLEAMASGLPVVVPASGGVLAYANSENSWLTPATGVEFAGAVRRLFEDDHARRNRIRRALETAEEFSWSRVTDRYFSLYDRILTDSKETSPPKWRFGDHPVISNPSSGANAIA